MASRSRKSGSDRWSARPTVVRYVKPARTITVRVPLPVSMPRARTVSYPYPSQRQLNNRVIRIPLLPPRQRFVVRQVKVRLPHFLPALGGSYVSVVPGRLNIHSRRQTKRLLEREFNRRRYEEHKTRSRKARHGQLESVRKDRFGILAEAARRGLGARAMADAALVSRALERRR